MKRLGRVLLISSAAVLPHLAAASPDPEPSLEPLGALSWRLDWTGAAGWTWFIQWSEDLETWEEDILGIVTMWTHINGAAYNRMFYRVREQ